MRTRFRAINVLISESAMALMRFPYVLLVSAIAAITLITIMELKDKADEWWLRLQLILALGIPLSFAISLCYENERMSTVRRGLTLVAGAIFLGLLFLSGQYSTEE